MWKLLCSILYHAGEEEEGGREFHAMCQTTELEVQYCVEYCRGVQCTVYSVRCTLRIADYTVHNVQCAVVSTNSSLYTLHSTLYNVNSALCNLHSSL